MTRCISVKPIKAPSLFDWEQGIPLHAMQRNRASSQSEREVSWFFSSYGGNLGYVLALGRGEPLNILFVQRHQDSCLVVMDTSGI